MQDFTMYDYTIKENKLLETLKEMHVHGYEPMIIINGEYYDIEWERGGNGENQD